MPQDAGGRGGRVESHRAPRPGVGERGHRNEPGLRC